MRGEGFGFVLLEKFFVEVFCGLMQIYVGFGTFKNAKKVLAEKSFLRFGIHVF